jgi:transcriptional regulator of arginine metabolism
MKSCSLSWGMTWTSRKKSERHWCGDMKISRQSKIIELISKYDIETQEELAERLMKDGYTVTQATVSRDIRELKLSKVAVDGGKQKYIALQKTEPGMSEKYARVLQDGFISMDMAQNILVVKTVPGMAMAVAAALDALQMNSVVGCIAGDDTVMCAVRSKEETVAAMERLGKILYNVP